MFKKIKISLVAAIFIVSGNACATNGYKMMGSGTHLGTAGAGVAMAMDPTDIALNPALLARQDNSFFVALGVFHPKRYVDTSGTTNPVVFRGAGGRQWSKINYFPDGSVGIKHDWKDLSIGLSVTGNGGMHTNYPYSRTVPGDAGGYDRGVFYRIININPAIAKKFGEKISVGISPTISYSDFRSDSATLPALAQTTGRNERDTVWGAGLRAGMDFKVQENLTFGLSAQTPTWYQRFEKYRDVLASTFNFPAGATV